MHFYSIHLQRRCEVRICGFAATKAAQHMLHVGTEAKLSVHAYFARIPPIGLLDSFKL